MEEITQQSDNTRVATQYRVPNQYYAFEDKPVLKQTYESPDEILQRHQTTNPKIMSGVFIIDGDKIIQELPTGLREINVHSDKDGNIVTLDGIILDESNTIEAPMPLNSFLELPLGRLPFHGGFINVNKGNLYDTIKEYNRRIQGYRDPSENFGNNLMTGFIGLAKQGIIKGLGQAGQFLFGKSGTGSLMSKLRTLASMPRKDLAKKLGQEVVKGGISLGVDTAVDAASRATTGKTVGEHTANVLSAVTATDVPTWVGDLVSPTQWIGYGSLNKIEREVLPFLPGRYKPLPDYMKVENRLNKPITTDRKITYNPTQESIDFINENIPDYKYYVTFPYNEETLSYSGVIKPTQLSKESKEAAIKMMKKLKKEGAYVPWNFRFNDNLYEWQPLDYNKDLFGIQFPVKYHHLGITFNEDDIKFARRLLRKDVSPLELRNVDFHEGASHATDRFVPKHIMNKYKKFASKAFNNDEVEVRATLHDTNKLLKQKLGEDYYEKMLPLIKKKDPKAIQTYIDALGNSNGYGRAFIEEQPAYLDIHWFPDNTRTFKIDTSKDLSTLIDFFELLPSGYGI